MTDETKPFAKEDLESRYPGGRSSSLADADAVGAPVYHGTLEGKQKRRVFIAVMVMLTSCLVTLVICIIEGVSQGSQGFLYFMHAAVLFGFVLMEFLLYRFIKSQDLSNDKVWFLYVVAFGVMVQSLFLDIVVTR